MKTLVKLSLLALAALAVYYFVVRPGTDRIKPYNERLAADPPGTCAYQNCSSNNDCCMTNPTCIMYTTDTGDKPEGRCA